MGKTKKLMLTGVLLLCAQFCFAKQISFQIIQYDDRTQDVTEQSLVIEDELLNGLFETGYIVTNSPTVVSDSGDETSLYNKAMGDAYEGFSDYFIQIKLYYSNALNQINWSIASVNSGKKIKESVIKGSVTTADEKGLKKISSELVTEITNFLKSYKA
ncbi:MAG: hypothetical protein J5726_04295 [Treponema sp.]|nr:hypothetical protein [Treponema sp.]